MRKKLNCVWVVVHRYYHDLDELNDILKVFADEATARRWVMDTVDGHWKDYKVLPYEVNY